MVTSTEKRWKRRFVHARLPRLSFSPLDKDDAWIEQKSRHTAGKGGGEKRKGGEGGEQEEEGNEKRWMEGREREREKEAEICKFNFRRTNSVHWGHLKKTGGKKLVILSV